MKQYKVVPITSGMFTGRFDASKLEEFLNSLAQHGWQIRTTFKEETRGTLPGSREALFVIMERDAPATAPPELPKSDPTPQLLRQLLRAYNIEPEA